MGVRHLHISVRETIGARSNRSHACSLQGASEQLDVGLLVDRDVFQVVIVGDRVPCVHEVLLAEVLDGSMIEGVLEVFELTNPCQHWDSRRKASQHTVNANWRTVVSMLVDCLGDKPAGSATAWYAPRIPAAINEDFIFLVGLDVAAEEELYLKRGLNAHRGAATESSQYLYPCGNISSTEAVQHARERNH